VDNPMGEWKEVYRERNTLGGIMQVGSLVRHRLTGEIGVIVHTNKHPRYCVRWVDTLYSNYPHMSELEVICE